MRITRCRICDTLCVRTGAAQPCAEAEHCHALAIRKPADQLERLKGDQQRIVIEFQFNASLHEMEFVLGSTHVVVCDRGLT